jgi:hypothetical protein
MPEKQPVIQSRYERAMELHSLCRAGGGFAPAVYFYLEGVSAPAGRQRSWWGDDPEGLHGVPRAGEEVRDEKDPSAQVRLSKVSFTGKVIVHPHGISPSPFHDLSQCGSYVL